MRIGTWLNVHIIWHDGRLMRIVIERYYGDNFITMSRLSSGDFVCEAREVAFKDYDKVFDGCSKYCLPVGVFRCNLRSTPLSPMTISIADAAGHKGCKIGWNDAVPCVLNMVLLGMCDDDSGRLVRQRETFKEFEALIRDAWVRGESFEVEVRNAIEMETNID